MSAADEIKVKQKQGKERKRERERWSNRKKREGEIKGVREERDAHPAG